jgi:hypothetical protein
MRGKGKSARRGGKKKNEKVGESQKLEKRENKMQ